MVNFITQICIIFEFWFCIRPMGMEWSTLNREC